MDKSLLSQSPVITDRTTKLLRRQLMSDATQTDLPPMDKNNVSVMTEELNRLEGIRLTLEHYHALQWKALQLRQQQEKDRLETQIATLHEAITRQSLVENNFETGGDTTPTVENSQTENFFNHFRHDAITYDGDVNNARINSSTPTKNQLSPSTQTIRRPPLETSPLATPQKCSPRTKRSSISPTKVDLNLQLKANWGFPANLGLLKVSHSLNVLKRRLPQLVRGYLTRRIMNTEKIRGICTLITVSF